MANPYVTFGAESVWYPELKINTNPEPETLFTNSSGGECGRHRVKFRLIKQPQLVYPIDNSDLEDLLRLIASCAAE